MSSGAKKKLTSRPEIKMTKSSQLKQKPIQPSRSRSGSLQGASPSPLKKLQDSDRTGKAIPSPGPIRKTKSLNPPVKSLLFGKQSTDSLDSACATSRDGLHSSSYSLNSAGQASSGSGGSSSSKVRQLAQSVTNRLYQTRGPKPELKNFLRKRDRKLPNFERKTKGSPASEPKSKKLPVIQDMDMVDSREKVYDWLHRKVHSQEDVSEQKAFILDLPEKAVLRKRRTSDPKGDIGAKFIKEYNRDLEDGYNRQGVSFIKDYFQKVLVWLSPKVDSFLTARNLGRHNRSATNEERYFQTMRSSIVRPGRKVKTVNFVDIMDIPTGEVTMDKFNSFKYEAEEEEEPVVKPVIVVDVGMQTDRITVDASTNTLQPKMMNKLIETDRKYNKGTSTDDLQKFVNDNNKPVNIPIIHFQGSTSFESLSDASVTPRASAVDEEAESSSAYGSLSSSGVRFLMDKVNNLQKETNDKYFVLDRLSKAVMTDDETSKVHQELNRLANERIEILELLVLNIGDLPSSLTVELLEAKLNYSIGQTDQLLAMLEESWMLESDLETSRNKQLVNITQEIINQSRNELAESKKAIKICLEEVKHVLAGGLSRKRALSAEILRMKRRAEIEAFKLERMWEQLFHERTKKRESYIRSSLATVGKPLPKATGTDTGVDAMQSYVQYLSDLRQRSVLAASEEDLNDLRLQTSYMTLPDYHHHADNSWETSSITSTSSSYLSPRVHKDHLVELRRQIVADTDRGKVASPSRLSSSSYTSGLSSGYWPGSSTRYTSSTSTSTTSGYDRFSKYTSSTLSSTRPSRTEGYKSTYKSSSFRSAHPDLLSPARPSYRAAGRYSVK